MADSDEDQALIESAIAAYRFTPQDTQALAETIYQHRLAARSAAYRHVARTAQARLPADWKLTEAQMQSEAEAAWTAARQIAETYNTDLRWQVEGLVEAERSVRSPLAGIRDRLRSTLFSWGQSRATWKSAQVGHAETSDAADSGTFDCIGELVRGDVTPGVDLRNVTIACLPLISSNDVCSQYAGRSFSLDEYEAIRDVMPAHANCPHYFAIDMGG